MLRETFSTARIPRQPEPMVMASPRQVDAFAEAGRIDGVMAASYLLQTARISQTVQGCDHVLDLGCGPATQLAQIAAMNPGISFTGVDLSEAMLNAARDHVAGLGLMNVEFLLGDITDMRDIGDRSVDGVISTMTLHHLPTIDHLRACFSEIARVLKPEGAVYLVDFGRLKSLKSIKFFARLNEAHQPLVFTEDYEYSLRAAFLFDEFKGLTEQELPSHVRALSTFLVPMLTVIKSADRPLAADFVARLRQMRRDLPVRYRRDLDDLRLFFRLGGLANDPF